MQQRILILSPQGELLNYIGSGRASYSDGDFSKVSFNGPRGLAYDAARNTLYIADAKNGRIRAVDMKELTVSTILGNGDLNGDPGSIINGALSPLPYPLDLALDYDILYISTTKGIWKMDLNSQVAEPISHTQSLGPLFGIEVKSNGEIVATDANGNAIYAIDDKYLTKLTPDDSIPGLRNGKKEEIAFNHPMGFTLQDDEMYVADQYNNSLRTFNVSKIKAETLTGDTLAGYKNGNSEKALFQLPSDIKRLGDKYYCADLGNHAIRILDENGSTTNTLPLLDYQSLCYGYKPPVMILNDGPEITLAKGDSIVSISFELSGDFAFDPNGFSYVDITTRKRDAAVLKDDDLSDGDISLAIRDALSQPMEVTVDLNMYFYDRRYPGIPYYKSTSYTFPVKSGTETTELNPIVIHID
jgi:DNA-binding beta-propeller fold protein YncE